jgi:hypothetical protein
MQNNYHSIPEIMVGCKMIVSSVFSIPILRKKCPPLEHVLNHLVKNGKKQNFFEVKPYRN